MPNTHTANIEAMIETMEAEMLAALGFDPKKPPPYLDDKQAAAAIGVKPGTLSVWRSTGRYNLPYIKVGRLVRYRPRVLAEFMVRRTAYHTGEVA